MRGLMILPFSSLATTSAGMSLLCDRPDAPVNGLTRCRTVTGKPFASLALDDVQQRLIGLFVTVFLLHDGTFEKTVP